VSDLSERDRSIDMLIAKDAIGTVLNRYAQAVDRCDLEQLKSVYWPEATDDHGLFSGNAIKFAEFIIPTLLAERHSVHLIGNIDIQIESSNRAMAQSYFMAYHEHEAAHGTIQFNVGGRYLDRFERRGQEWRISERVVLMDWNQKAPSTASWEGGEAYSALKTGGRFPTDFFYGWRSLGCA
jgi:hypothetical protein